jgi:GTP-binding protein EngB required for normal cell division
MVNAASSNSDEKEFWENVETQFEEKVQDFSKTLNIAIIGKVSSGKSSLINALLKLSRKKAIIRLDERVLLIDSPGLDDVRAENSQITREFLKHIDVGILVVTGAADASQKRYLDDLRSHCESSVFVALNKIDEWDDLEPSALEDIVNQWKQVLQAEKIYPVCSKGYDPKTKSGTPLDIRGVYWLREDIENFLGSKGKDLLLARHMGEKKSYAIGIISIALAAVTVQAFIPGSAAYIAATQASAIVALTYLYTGEILSSKASFALLPAFASEAVGTTLFLWVKSFLPPTGIVDVAAAVIAVSITLAILATINSILASGAKLEEEELLKSKFRTYRKQAETALKGLALTDLKDLPSLKAIIEKFI